MGNRGVKVVLIQGDALKVLPSLPELSVDLVVSDPPYNVLGDVDGVSEKAKKWDYFPTLEAYERFSVDWLNKVYRVMKPGASCFVFWSERHLFLFDKILRQTPFKLYKIVIWHYPNILKGFSNTRWHNTFDFIFHLVKGESPRTFNAKFVDSENKDVWIFPKPQHNFNKDKMFHPTQKPLELIKRIVKMFSNPGDVVLDPFAGSGTTCLAAMELGRSSICIEIDPEYIEIAKKRIGWNRPRLSSVEFQLNLAQP